MVAFCGLEAARYNYIHYRYIIVICCLCETNLHFSLLIFQQVAVPGDVKREHNHAFILIVNTSVYHSITGQCITKIHTRIVSS